MAQNPVFGVGPAAFGAAAGHGMQPHNLYGQVLGETGTLGALALLGILAGFALNHLEARALSRRATMKPGCFPARVSSAIMLTVGLLLFKGWSDHNLYRYTWLWFGAFQSIAIRCMRFQVKGLGRRSQSGTSAGETRLARVPGY